jgi:MFS family permease
LLAKWFDRHRATAVALNASGASVGGLLLVPLTVYLIHLIGWRLTWVVLGLLILFLVLPLAYVFLKDDPAELGLRPDGDPQPPETGQAAPTRPGPLAVAAWRDAFRATPIWQHSRPQRHLGVCSTLLRPSAHPLHGTADGV